MHILFVSHYFHPEVGAAQTSILESARLLQARSHRVTVLTGFPNYPDGVIPEPYRGRWRQTEWLDGIRVVRTAVYPAPNSGFSKRLVNHASFALSSLMGVRAVGKPDVIVAETPPLFTAAAAVAIARLVGARLLLNVSDLWPESAVQLGMLSNPAAIRPAEAIEQLCYRHADAIAVPTPGMRTIVLSQGHDSAKVKLLPNAVDVERFAVRAPQSQTNERPRRAIYCGTLGLAQRVGTLLEAAEILERSNESIEISIVGDGADRRELEEFANSHGLSSVTFEGRVPRDEVPQRIASADIAVMLLRDVPLFEDALPTKLLEYMAAARPVVASASGQVEKLIGDIGAGVACRPEDPVALAASLVQVAADPERGLEMGARGRRYVSQHLSRRAIVDRLEFELDALLSGKGDIASD